MYAAEAVKIWKGDLSEHASRPLSKDLIEKADLIFGMTPSHVKEILRMAPQASGKTFLFRNFPDPDKDGEGVDDPIGQSLDRYNQTFLEIGEILGRHLPEIVQRVDEKIHA